MYRKKVPPELVKHYESAVFSSKFFRRGNQFTHTLNVPGAAQPDDLIGITIYHSFTMINLTAEDLDFDFECETSLVPEAPPKDLHQCFELRANNALQTVGAGALTNKPGYQALVLKHKTPIPAGASRFFEAKFDTVRRMRDAEILMTTWPADGVTVTVIFPASLDVVANSLHLTRVPTGNNSCKWSLASGMVPGQGIFIAWEPIVRHPEELKMAVVKS